MPNLENSAVAKFSKFGKLPSGLGKVSFHSSPKERICQRMFKLRTIPFILHASKECLKFSKPGSTACKLWTSRCSSWISKGRETREQITNICWIIEKAREFQKNIYFCFIDYAKVFDYVDHNKLWKILRDGNTRLPYLPPEKSVCRSRSNS